MGNPRVVRKSMAECSEWEQRAVRMRAMGMTYKAIGKEIGKQECQMTELFGDGGILRPVLLKYQGQLAEEGNAQVIQVHRQAQAELDWAFTQLKEIAKHAQSENVRLQAIDSMLDRAGLCRRLKSETHQTTVTQTATTEQREAMFAKVLTLVNAEVTEDPPKCQD